jgi:hypothetical protein
MGVFLTNTIVPAKTLVLGTYVDAVQGILGKDDLSFYFFR